jgi:biofilm PGA synthesis protein PgaA
MDRRDYDLAEAEIGELSLDYPEEPAVQLLEERWEIHQRSELQADARFGTSSGETFGQDQYTVDTIWFSSPFAYRYRAYLQTHDAYSEFPEGDGRRRRLGGGIEYRYRRWLASAGLSASRGGGDVGLRSRIGYRYSDTITLGGRFETRSNEAPLRGARVGVSATAAGAEIDYSPHESAWLGAGVTLVDLSDGNRTVSARVAGGRRLLNRPAYKLTALGEVDASRSRRDDVAYFSPRRSLGWMLGLRNDHTLHRRYDFAVSHAFTARAGRYDQQGYGAGGVWDLEYLVRTDIDRRWRAYAGVTRTSRVYDGDREYSTFFVAGLGARF